MKPSLFILLFLLLHVCACSDYSDSETTPPSLIFKDQPTIDSLYKLESYDALRLYAHKSLQQLSDTDCMNRSYLYDAMGISYWYSYHYDSAVYYHRMAYDIASKSKNISQQAHTGSNLLLTYLQSSIYKKQQDTIFQTLNDMQDKVMPLNTKALLLDALANYCRQNDMMGVSQFFLSKSQPVYDKLIADQSMQLMDSLHLGAHYLYLDEVGRIAQDNTKRKTYLKNSRYWLGTNKGILGKYYSRMVNMRCYIDNDTDVARSYLDSVIALQNTTGLNLNDIIINTNFWVCDYYFFIVKNYKVSQQYCSQINEYLDGSIDPSSIISAKWMQADIDLKEARYRQSLALFKVILPQKKQLTSAAQLRVAESIATCYNKLGLLDSAILYYKQITPLTIESYSEQQRNIQQEADTKYLNKIKQHKIEEQHRSLQYSRNKQLWLIIGLALAVLSMALLYIIYRNKRKTARKLDTQNIQLSHLNEQLKEANETKSKLFGIISHDLRSPISQLYQLMKLQLPDSGIVLEPEEKEMLEQETHDATISLLDSMEDLLIWSKTQLQSFKPTTTWVDLNEMITKCKDLSQLQIRNKKIELINTIATNVMLETDANFLLTILRNLIHNAINASPHNASITISFAPLAHTATQYCIRIENQGAPFSQQDYLNALSNTQTSHFLKGGLGLQVIDELSRKIKIEVFFETQAQSGSCCCVKLNCKVRF